MALAVALSACAEAGSATATTVVRDSAGIRIVETEATARCEAPWQVEDTETWGVGAVEGAPAYLLSRVVGAMQRPDGSVLVADGTFIEREVTDSIKARALEVLLRDVDEARRPEVRGDVAAWEWPERVPAHTALKVDPEGVVWTRAFSADPLDGEAWSLLDPEEGYLGDIHLRPGQELLEIGSDHLLVLSRNELDVERVEKHGLRR